MSFEISIFKSLVLPALWLSQFLNEKNFVLVCKGYASDCDSFTGVYWQDDIENCLDYTDYKIWINFFQRKLW